MHAIIRPPPLVSTYSRTWIHRVSLPHSRRLPSSVSEDERRPWRGSSLEPFWKLKLMPLFHQQRHDVTASPSETWQPTDQQAERDLGSFPVELHLSQKKKRLKWTPEELHKNNSFPLSSPGIALPNLNAALKEWRWNLWPLTRECSALCRIGWFKDLENITVWTWVHKCFHTECYAKIAACYLCTVNGQKNRACNDEDMNPSANAT